MFGEDSGNRKKQRPPLSTQLFTVLLVLCPHVSPNHCTVGWTIAFIYECVCSPTISLWIGQYILFMSTCAFPNT